MSVHNILQIDCTRSILIDFNFQKCTWKFTWSGSQNSDLLGTPTPRLSQSCTLAPPLESIEELDPYLPSAPRIELIEQHIDDEIVFFDDMASRLEDCADERPAHLYPTGYLPPEQALNYKFLLDRIADSGLPIYFSRMFKENHNTVHDTTFPALFRDYCTMQQEETRVENVEV